VVGALLIARSYQTFEYLFLLLSITSSGIGETVTGLVPLFIAAESILFASTFCARLDPSGSDKSSDKPILEVIASFFAKQSHHWKITTPQGGHLRLAMTGTWVLMSDFLSKVSWISLDRIE
jgi:hypothetical protein